MHMQINRLLVLSALLLSSSLGTIALAQAPATGGPAPAAAPTGVPLDGGASLLLAAGVGLGLKRLRARRRS